MAVALGDLPVLVVDLQLGALVLADLATGIDGSLFGVVVATGLVGPAPLYVPAAVRVGDNVVGLAAFAAHESPYGGRLSIATLNFLDSRCQALLVSLL